MLKYSENDEYQNTKLQINAFGHIWQPFLKKEPKYDSALSKLIPPPFEAFGHECMWKLIECNIQHTKSCEEYTFKTANEFELKKMNLLKNYNSIFGVTRNKSFIAKMRQKKKIEEKIDSDDSYTEEEQSEDDSVESDRHSKSSESYISDEKSIENDDDDISEKSIHEESESDTSESSYEELKKPKLKK